ncbi:hypothetical protein [Microcoleus sp. CAWBG24]|nr:hypothetical protein [Microcoleus sp. CAWBG24]
MQCNYSAGVFLSFAVPAGRSRSLIVNHFKSLNNTPRSTKTVDRQATIG